jgi:hypothetical protein
VSDAVTYAIELAVGVACIAAAVGLRRARTLRWLVALLIAGGVAATVHALVSL